jgi:putative transposase
VTISSGSRTSNPIDAYRATERVLNESCSRRIADATVMITNCGRICWQARKMNVSQVFAGQQVGITQVGERVWLVTFMHYDLGYFDDETCRLEPIQNPFGPKVLPMSPE